MTGSARAGQAAIALLHISLLPPLVNSFSLSLMTGGCSTRVNPLLVRIKFNPIKKMPPSSPGIAVAKNKRAMLVLLATPNTIMLRLGGMSMAMSEALATKPVVYSLW
ncbi:hypothetical protein ES703_102978 [subsurface metagenome]